MKSYREILLFFCMFLLFCLFFTAIGFSFPQVFNLKQEIAITPAKQLTREVSEPVLIKVLAAIVAISELAPFLSTKAKGVIHGLYLVIKSVTKKRS